MGWGQKYLLVTCGLSVLGVSARGGTLTGLNSFVDFRRRVLPGAIVGSPTGLSADTSDGGRLKDICRLLYGAVMGKVLGLGKKYFLVT